MFFWWVLARWTWGWSSYTRETENRSGKSVKDGVAKLFQCRPRCVSGRNFLSCDDTMGPFFGDTFFRELMRGCRSVSDEIRKKWFFYAAVLTIYMRTFHGSSTSVYLIVLHRNLGKHSFGQLLQIGELWFAPCVIWLVEEVMLTGHGECWLEGIFSV